jgi:hypothetical protein
LANWKGIIFEGRVGVDFAVSLLLGDRAGHSPGAISRLRFQTPEEPDDISVHFEDGTNWRISAKGGSLKCDWRPDSPFGGAMLQFQRGAHPEATSGHRRRAPRLVLAVAHRCSRRIIAFGSWLDRAKRQPSLAAVRAAQLTREEGEFLEGLGNLLAGTGEEHLYNLLLSMDVRQYRAPSQWHEDLIERLMRVARSRADAEAVIDALIVEVQDFASEGGTLTRHGVKELVDGKGVRVVMAGSFRGLRVLSKPPVQELQQLLVPDTVGLSELVEREELLDAASEGRSLIVTGKPGSGKSTALAALGSCLCKDTTIAVGPGFRGEASIYHLVSTVSNFELRSVASSSSPPAGDRAWAH